MTTASMHRFETAIAAGTPTNTVVRLCECGTDETLAFVVIDGRPSFADLLSVPAVRQMVADAGFTDADTGSYYLAAFSAA